MEPQPSIASHNEEYKVRRDEKGAVLKPRQPLSSYNLFFQMERKKILASDDGKQDHGPITVESLHAMLSQQQKSKAKRVHRRTHGKISFRALAKTIALRWKNVDEESRKVLDHQAAILKQNYVKQLLAWKEWQKNESLKPKADDEKTLHAHEETVDGTFPSVKDQSNRHQELQAHEMTRVSQQTVLATQFSGIQRCFSPLLEDSDKIMDLFKEFEAHIDDDSNNFKMSAQCKNRAGFSTPSSFIGATASSVDEKQGSIFNEVMFSPIFREASLSGYDLFDALDSNAMDQLFD